MNYVLIGILASISSLVCAINHYRLLHVLSIIIVVLCFIALS